MRRIFSVDDELRLGVQVLSTRATALDLNMDLTKRDSVWEDAMKFEATYRERNRKGIALGEGDLMLEPKLATVNSQFAVRRAGGNDRVRVSRLLHDGETYQRVLLEPLR